MKAIDRAKSHFDNLDIKKIEVPEWGEEDKPVTNLNVVPMPVEEDEQAP